MQANEPTTTIRRWHLLLAVIALVAAACGGNGEQSSNADDAEPPAAVSAGDPAAEDTTEADDDSNTDSADDNDNDERGEQEVVDLAGLQVVTTNGLGGWRLGVSPDVGVLHEGELFELRPPGGSGRIMIARVSSARTGASVSTVEEFIDAAVASAPVTVEATGDSLTVLGYDLEEHTFRLDGEGGDPRLFPSSFVGMSSNMGWAPLPVADLYLGEADGGVLAVGVVADDESSLPALHAALDEVVPTLSLTGPAVLPVPEAPPIGITQIGEPDPITPREVDDGLQQPFAPVEPGTYDLANLPQPTLVDVGEGWFVAPNFPGFVVFADRTAGRASGPGDHDVSFLQGATGLHSIGPVRGDVTEPVPLQTPEEFEAFLAEPPSGLLVSNVDAGATLGGQTVVQFDLVVDPDATCQDDSPCLFLFSAPGTSFVKFVGSGLVNRFWWYPEGSNGGLLVSATAPAASVEWLDGRAAALLDTLEIG